MDDDQQKGHPPSSLPQPMRLGQVVRIGMTILRRRWAALIGVAALLVGPAALLTAATGIRLSSVLVDAFPGVEEGLLADPTTLTGAEVERIGGAFAVYLLATTFAGALATIGALGFSAVVAADYHGRSIEVSRALRACLHRALSALVIIVVTTLIIVAIIAAGLALIVLALSLLGGSGAQRGGPGAFVALIVGVAMVVAVLYLTIRWAMTLPVLAIEDQGWRQGLRRSWHLSGDNVWRTFAIVAIAAMVTAVLGALLVQLLSVVLVDVVAASLGLDPIVAETLATALTTVVLAPIAPVLVAVLFFDLRTRRDPRPDSASVEPA
ncbi:MAG: glycerophosphoryl diester phosphodiesterase membrane domain-containing protein [Chloroflexota bacterium]